MNKSTPISQLPSQPGAQGFVNEQQKQLFNQAQTAVQNMTLPQNTQPSADIVHDDDATIQEVLNSFNNSPSQPTIEHMTQPSQSLSMNPTMQQLMAQAQMSPAGLDPMMLNMLSAASSQGMTMPPPSTSYVSSIENFIHVFADDIKLAAIVFIAFVAVNFVSLERFIGRYIAIERIPYHDILLKALLAAVAIIVVRRIISK